MNYFVSGSLVYNKLKQEIVLVESIELEDDFFYGKLLIKEHEEQDITNKNLKKFYTKDFEFLTHKDGVYKFTSFNNKIILINFELFDVYKKRSNTEYCLETNSGSFYKLVNFVTVADFNHFKLAYQAFNSCLRYIIYS